MDGTKELRRMNRQELLELLLEATEENESLNRRIQSLEEQLASRDLAVGEAGSIAEAALAINGVFDAAQAAAAQYLDNIRRLNDNQGAVCQQMEETARAKAQKICEDADAYSQQVRTEADEYSQQVRTEADEYSQQVRTEADEYSQQVHAGADEYHQKACAEADEYSQQVRTEADEYSKRRSKEADLYQKQIIENIKALLREGET